MTDYRKDALKRGYNPFDYPEEWEFFKHPFEEDEVEKDHTSFENEKKAKPRRNIDDTYILHILYISFPL
jgi:hypothetical protein